MSKKPFITVDHITVRLLQRLMFQDTSWRIHTDEHWAILGPNGAGKSTFVRALWGGVLLQKGRILLHFSDTESGSRALAPREMIGYVSFETHQRLMEQEEMMEDLRAYADKRDEITTARDVVYSGILAARKLNAEDEARCAKIAALLEIHPLLGRNITSLSTGEMRKILIARALIKAPKLLILDEPFDGLDEEANRSLSGSIDKLMAGPVPIRVILVVHRLEEIAPHISHVLLIKEGRILMQGPKDEVLTSENISRLYGCPLYLAKECGKYRVFFKEHGSSFKSALPMAGSKHSDDVPEILIEMEDTTVRYGGQPVLDQLNWMMKRGENWAIFGPNGSGKSTILKLILGENLQGYSNKVFLFGRQKGTGETLWEIKKKIGVVSSELQIKYRKKMNAYDVIASGFHDSIGLYQYPTPEQKKVVDQWIGILHIEDIACQNFDHLSYGQKRMILIARAMVKSPLLLIADEPCHGLDIPNRKRVLDIIERIGRTETNLLYVTNLQEEIPDCITHILLLQKGKVLKQGEKEEVHL